MAAFSLRPSQLQDIARAALDQAKALGAEAAVRASEGMGLEVRVRQGALESIERNQDKGLSVTLYLDQRQGNASTSDFSAAAIAQTVRAAYDIARFTERDDCLGLPDAALLARDYVDPALHYPWDIGPEDALHLAQRMESAGFAVDRAIQNSEGASVSTQQSHFVLANTLGFMGGFAYSSHDLSCSLIAARGKGGRDMQRDYWYSSHCDASALAAPEAIGRYCAERALARLSSQRLSTRSCPVLFEAPLACGLLGAFMHAVSGGALYRRATFLHGSLGQDVFPDHIDMTEDPFKPRASGSGPFDGEGVITSAREVVRAGRVEGYFLSTYSARKLGMTTTGNAGGAHNLEWTSRHTTSRDTLPAMLERMGEGLFITEQLGHATNLVTGDFSCGVAGYWVSKGRIQFPVHEITIAGNLRSMFRGMVAIGADRFERGSLASGSVLINDMRVGGTS